MPDAGMDAKARLQALRARLVVPKDDSSVPMLPRLPGSGASFVRKGSKDVRSLRGRAARGAEGNGVWPLGAAAENNGSPVKDMQRR